MKLVIFTLYISFLVCFTYRYFRKIKNIPFHSDTAEFLYPGLVRALGQKFEPCELVDKAGWWGSALGVIHQFLSKKKINNMGNFPPEKYCELSIQSQYIKGGNPVIQQKFGIYGFHSCTGRIHSRYPFFFRIIHAAMIFFTSLIFLIILFQCIQTWLFGILGSIMIVILMTQPFIDNHQIHSEMYGVFGIAVILMIMFLIPEYIERDPGTIYFYSGILLSVLVLLVKITFIADAVMFGMFPFFLQIEFVRWDLLEGLIAGISGILICFSVTPYYRKLIQIHSISNLLGYRKAAPSLGVGTSVKDKTSFKDMIYSDFGILFDILLLLFIILGGFLGYYLYQGLSNLYGFVFLWLIVNLLVMKVQNKYYASHFIPLICPAVFYIIIVMSTLVTTSQWHEPVFFLVNVLTGFVCFCITSGVFFLFFTFYLSTNPLDFFLYPYRYRKNPYLLQLLSAPIIGADIKQKSNSKDRILVFGYTSSVYIYSGRRAALEFLEGSLGIDPEVATGHWEQRWKWWFCRDVHKFKPLYIIDMDGRLNIDTIESSTGLRYSLEETYLGCFPLYRRNKTVQGYNRFAECDEDELVQLKTRNLSMQKQINQCIYQDGLHQGITNYVELKTLWNYYSFLFTNEIAPK